MLITTSIHSDNDKYELLAFLSEEGDSYENPILMFNGGTWDNSQEIWEDYQIALATGVFDGIPEEDTEEVIEMFNEGEELGFFENYGQD